MSKKSGPKIAFIGRCDFGGLGVESIEFHDYFKPKMMLVITGELRHNTKRFKNVHSIVIDAPTDDELDDFLTGVDVLFAIETPYNWKAFKIAREKGVKSILRVNYEWLPSNTASKPDLYIAPSVWNYDDIPDPKVYIPFPINRKKLPFKLKKKAKRFIHIAGNMKAGYDRNGTEEFLKAIPLIKSDIEIIIRSQKYIPNITDKRVKLIVDDNPDYTSIWSEPADVFVMPRRYAGQSLSLNEAMSLGMAVITTDMKPQNEFIPQEMLIPVHNSRHIQIKRPVEIVDVKAEDIAKKIDEVANKDISYYSRKSDIIAHEWSWETLGPKLLKTFEEI